MYAHIYPQASLKTQPNTTLYGRLTFLEIYGFPFFWPTKRPCQKIFGELLDLNKTFKLTKFGVNLIESF